MIFKFELELILNNIFFDIFEKLVGKITVHAFILFWILCLTIFLFMMAYFHFWFLSELNLYYLKQAHRYLEIIIIISVQIYIFSVCKFPACGSHTSNTAPNKESLELLTNLHHTWRKVKHLESYLCFCLMQRLHRQRCTTNH